MYKTLCTVADIGRGVVLLYVCARDGIHVWYISISASLTMVSAVMSAPFSRSREQMVVWPFQAALCNALRLSYNN